MNNVININRLAVDTFQLLKTYCEIHNFAGWDPYDGLIQSI
jgi:hypothetical protein